MHVSISIALPQVSGECVRATGCSVPMHAAHPQLLLSHDSATHSGIPEHGRQHPLLYITTVVLTI